MLTVQDLNGIETDWEEKARSLEDRKTHSGFTSFLISMHGDYTHSMRWLVAVLCRLAAASTRACVRLTAT